MKNNWTLDVKRDSSSRCRKSGTLKIEVERNRPWEVDRKWLLEVEVKRTQNQGIELMMDIE